MTNRTCTVDGCASPHRAKGLCFMHYMRVRRNGTLKARPLHDNPENAFAANTSTASNGCIVWTAAKQSRGYGVMRTGNKSVLVHRYAWERVNGPIPDGMFVDHKCWDHACVNVEHLRLADPSQNGQNREGPASGTKSGVRGVSWYKNYGKWEASVTLNGVKHSGGYFADKEEAGRVALEMRQNMLPYAQN